MSPPNGSRWPFHDLSPDLDRPEQERVMTGLTCVVTVALLLVLFTQGAAAQTVTSTTGAINGIGTDSTKSILPGVTVTLSGPARMGTSTAVTDQNRPFRFST